MKESIALWQLILSYIGFALIGFSSWVRYDVVTEKRPDEKGKRAFWSKALEWGGIVLLMFLLMRT